MPTLSEQKRFTNKALALANLGKQQQDFGHLYAKTMEGKPSQDVLEKIMDDFVANLKAFIGKYEAY